MKIIDDDGKDLPWDGKTFGHLKVRGPWIARAISRATGRNCSTADGWFETGDVAHIDPDGYMQITDRSKDVIKSGGEWIHPSTWKTRRGHPGVAEAAVIGIPHPKWDERPLLVIVRKEGAEVSPRAGALEYMKGKIAKWWMPDDVVFVDEIPHTATGKISKLTLREKFKDYVLPTA